MSDALPTASDRNNLNEKERGIQRTLPKFPKLKMDRCHFLDHHIINFSSVSDCSMPYFQADSPKKKYNNNELVCIYRQLK